MRCELNRLLICNLQSNVKMSLQAVTVNNQASRHEDGVSFTSWTLHTTGKSLYHPPDRRSYGTQNRCGRHENENILCPFRRSNPDFSVL